MRETVAIIGAGPLGRRLALAAARAEFCVVLEDVMPQNLHHAQEWIRQELGPGFFASHTHADDRPLGLVGFVSTVEDAVREADLVIDCVPDELESKLEIFCLLDRMAPPRTVIATPTTRLSIADLASCTYRPDRCIGIAVEAQDLAATACGDLLLRQTSETSAAALDLVQRFWIRLGFKPRFELDPLEKQTLIR